MAKDPLHASPEANNDENGMVGGREVQVSDLCHKHLINISVRVETIKRLLKIPFSDKEISHSLCNKEMSVCSPPKRSFEPTSGQSGMVSHI